MSVAHVGSLRLQTARAGAACMHTEPPLPAVASQSEGWGHARRAGRGQDTGLP